MIPPIDAHEENPTMQSTVLTRWEELRDITKGPKRHRQAVADWLSTRPAVLYWGDSWFSTPLYPNLARQSAARIDGLRMIVGKPGATAAQLMSAREIDRMCDRIKANPFDLLCLSAGGNDSLSDRLKQVFKPWMTGSKAKITPQDAFTILVASKLFERLRERYELLLDALTKKVQAGRPHFRVVGHGYVPLSRIGAAGDLTIDNIGLIAILKDDVGPWLFGPMKKVLNDAAAGKVFADLLLLDGFRDLVMQPLKSTFPGLFTYVDLSLVAGLDNPAMWYDEIHPTENGFALCVGPLNDALRAALPATKRAAVS
jgi:hypothetical protein